MELSALLDPVLERTGFPLDHPYLERVYCSVLGPTSTLLLRRAGELLAEHPDGCRVELVDLSRVLGIGAPGGQVGRTSPVYRALDRVAQFHLATWLDEHRYAVHTKVPALTKSRAARLPEPIQAVHHQLLTSHVQGLVAEAQQRPGPEGAPARRAPAIPFDADVGTARGTVADHAGPVSGATVEAPGSAVASRLAAFGAETPGSRGVIR